MGRDAGKGYGTGCGKSIRKYRERKRREMDVREGTIYAATWVGG
jgi:hypothetical protein